MSKIARSTRFFLRNEMMTAEPPSTKRLVTTFFGSDDQHRTIGTARAEAGLGRYLKAGVQNKTQGLAVVRVLFQFQSTEKPGVVSQNCADTNHNRITVSS